MQEVHPHLKNFIIEYCSKYNIHVVDPESLKLETSIDLDLDICDIEIDLFLAEFALEFNIDQSKFSWYKYGYPKGSPGVKLIKAVFGYKRPWVKRLSRKLYTPKFNISNLQQAVITGKLL